jgi:hypothetical protein
MCPIIYDIIVESNATTPIFTFCIYQIGRISLKISNTKDTWNSEQITAKARHVKGRGGENTTAVAVAATPGTPFPLLPHIPRPPARRRQHSLNLLLAKFVRHSAEFTG